MDKIDKIDKIDKMDKIEKIEKYCHKAQYYETDKMGIVHHSNYIRWFEEARMDLLEKLDFGYNKMEKFGFDIPVLSVTCQYKSMVHLYDKVYIIPKVEIFTGIRIIISYRIIDAVTSELRTTGETSHCFVNEKNKLISLKHKNKEVFTFMESLVGKDFFDVQL